MIIGHSRHIAYLDTVFRRGVVAHAYIFSGPSHIGKRLVAKEWIKNFFCASAEAGANEGEKICGVCAQCRQIDADAHPDVAYVSLEHQLIEKPKTEIGIETAREIKRRASLASYCGGYRFFLIDDAESLNSDAQNTLLKILEEPGKQTVFIFLAESASHLLPTVLSRSVVISFSAAPDAAMCAWLDAQKISKKEQEQLLALAQGKPGALTELLRDKEQLREVVAAKEKAEQMFGAGMIDLFRASDALALSDKKNQEQFFSYFFQELQKKMRSAQGKEQTRWLEKIKNILVLFRLFETTNVNQKIIFDHIFLALHS